MPHISFGPWFGGSVLALTEMGLYYLRRKGCEGIFVELFEI
jgi:hypothetical protein